MTKKYETIDQGLTKTEPNLGDSGRQNLEARAYASSVYSGQTMINEKRVAFISSGALRQRLYLGMCLCRGSTYHERLLLEKWQDVELRTDRMDLYTASPQYHFCHLLVW